MVDSTIKCVCGQAKRMKGSIEDVRIARRQFAQDHKDCRLKFDQDVYQWTKGKER